MSDLIERLRAKVDGAEPGGFVEVHVDFLNALITSQAAAVEDYNNALAEIEKLKEALREIATSEFVSDSWVESFARDALGETK